MPSLRARLRACSASTAWPPRCSRTCSAVACRSRASAAPAGRIVVLSAVLYPYVYMLARSAFIGQSRQAIEAARSLGNSYGRRSGASPCRWPGPRSPPARRWSMMEALADFGTVDLLGVQALTSADLPRLERRLRRGRRAAAGDGAHRGSPSSCSCSSGARGRARYHQALGGATRWLPKRLHGWQGWLAMVAPAGCCCGRVRPARSPSWSPGRSRRSPTARSIPGLTSAIFSSLLLLGALAAAAAVATGTIVAFGLRARATRTGRVSAAPRDARLRDPRHRRRRRRLRAAGLGRPPPRRRGRRRLRYGPRAGVHRDRSSAW